MTQPNYYAIIPANVRYSKEVPDGAKLLYGEITALCNQHGYCWANNRYFADLYQKSIDTIGRWIGDLARAGFILTLIDKEGGNGRTIWLSETQGATGKNAGRVSAKMPGGYRQKSGEATGKNAAHNNTVNNTLNNTHESSAATASALAGPFEKVGEVEIPSKPEPRVSGIAASRGGRRGAAEKDTHDPWTKTIASLFDKVGAECGIVEPFNWQMNAGRDFKALKEIRKGLTSDIAKKKAGAEPTETEIETGFEYLFRYGYKYLSDIASQKGGAVQYNPTTIKNCYNQIISYARSKRPTGTSKADQNRHDMAEYLAVRRQAAFARLYGEEMGTAEEV